MFEVQVNVSPVVNKLFSVILQMFYKRIYISVIKLHQLLLIIL